MGSGQVNRQLSEKLVEEAKAKSTNAGSCAPISILCIICITFIIFVTCIICVIHISYIVYMAPDTARESFIPFYLRCAPYDLRRLAHDRFRGSCALQVVCAALHVALRCSLHHLLISVEPCPARAALDICAHVSLMPAGTAAASWDISSTAASSRASSCCSR